MGTKQVSTGVAPPRGLPVRGDVTAWIGGRGGPGVRGCPRSQQVLWPGDTVRHLWHRSPKYWLAVTRWQLGGTGCGRGGARCPQSPWELRCTLCPRGFCPGAGGAAAWPAPVPAAGGWGEHGVFGDRDTALLSPRGLTVTRANVKASERIGALAG